MAEEPDWRGQMHRLGPEIVRLRYVLRQPILEGSPDPDPPFVETWLREEEKRSERRQRRILRWSITAAIAALVSAFAAVLGSMEAFLH